MSTLTSLLKPEYINRYKQIAGLRYTHKLRYEYKDRDTDRDKQIYEEMDVDIVI